MSRRATTLGVAIALLVILVGVARFVTVPYVILRPGPVTNTLGAVPAEDAASGQAGGPVISISGRPTYPTSGSLYLTTVEELPGDCDSHPHLFDAVRAWFSRTETVEPQQVECPPGQSSQAVQQQGEQEMSQSQSDAITAALFELGYHPTTQHVSVNTVDAGTPVASVLQPADVILAVNNKPVSTVTRLHAVIAALAPKATITLTIQRDGKTRTVTTQTVKGAKGTTMLGIEADRTATFAGIKVHIGIDPDNIGGPSAGTALALGIIDKLTPGGLTGGRTIAGTGTIDGYGNVGPIGGIQQKIAAAAHAGATVFFAPASECPDAKAAAPKSLTLVKVSTLRGAVTALKAIKAGSANFPHC
ncbi:MAG TPA: PDZ domain-containing protein [Mycobacteriales bacterium]|jgi:PDZ domain-containing protein|nr:PDZ domain-containing protein [Mycobacteriales bacterium]